MRQPPKMVKHTQTNRQMLPTNYLNVFDHFMGLAVKGLILKVPLNINRIKLI